VSFNFYIVTLSVFKKKIIAKSDKVMYFWCIFCKYIRFFYLVMSLTNYENGVAMVKRLGTTVLNWETLFVNMVCKHCSLTLLALVCTHLYYTYFAICRYPSYLRGVSILCLVIPSTLLLGFPKYFSDNFINVTVTFAQRCSYCGLTLWEVRILVLWKTVHWRVDYKVLSSHANYWLQRWK
jgi:hypothetical protein